MKILFGNSGQYGDLVMNTALARVIKREFPQATLIKTIGKKYAEIAPLFIGSKYIDGVYIMDSDNDTWNSNDFKYINDTKFYHVGNPTPAHTSEHWYVENGQGIETIKMNGLDPNGDNGKCELTQWFKTILDHKDSVAFNWIGGFYNYPNNKSLSVERAQEIVDFVRAQGLYVFQLGDPREPTLNNTMKQSMSIFETVRTMLSCRFLIGIDSFLTWAASGYDFPCLSMYSNAFYTPKYVRSIQPINPNGHYLDGFNLNDIPMDIIKQNILTLIEKTK